MASRPRKDQARRVRQHPAVQEGSKFLFDEMRDAAILLLPPSQECFELLRNDSV
jgi:hypothetical protein